jgi:hypothetical protein
LRIWCGSFSDRGELTYGNSYRLAELGLIISAADNNIYGYGSCHHSCHGSSNPRIGTNSLLYITIYQIQHTKKFKHVASQPHFHAYDFTRLGIHAVLRSGNSSPVACLSPTQFRSSMMPVFTIFPPGKKSPLRHSVVPQSPQKCDVMTPPESPFLVNSLGVPRDVSVGKERSREGGEARYRRRE